MVEVVRAKTEARAVRGDAARSPARPSATVYTRPVYPYPMVARYLGKGDPNDAANYEPVKAPVKTPMTFTTRPPS